jgi:hypothetical protein
MNSTATYSAEDNKLRLYVGRVPRADYERLRDAGFVSTPKQDCDFVAPWTPTREDIAREYLEDGEDIGDEDYSPEERAADKAERFGDYRDKRAEEAGAGADAFEAGPSAFGHQSRARAERQAVRHDRKRTYAVSQWAKAEYWQSRTKAVISHALYKSSAHVRRGRILTLEAEQRKHEKGREEYAARFAAWSKVATLEGADEAIRSEGGELYAKAAGKLAYALANTAGCWSNFTHPRTGKTDRSAYDLLTRDDPLTPGEVAALWLAKASDPTDPDTHAARWSAHYEHRLTYERAMLAEEGGTAAEAEMTPGGWIRASNRTGSVFTDVSGGWMQIHAVTKSPVTKRVTSVKVMGTVGYRDPKPGLVSINIERLPEGAYRAPTAEESEAFKAATKERKKAEKDSKPAAPSLVNPTDADAEKLQALWNARALAKFNEKKQYGAFNPSTLLRMTQAEYSKHSKGEYSSFETRTVDASGKPSRRSSNMWTSEGSAYDKSLGEVAVKIRVRETSDWHAPARVIVITDKPQKALPLDWSAIEAGTVGTSSAAKVEAEAVAV